MWEWKWQNSRDSGEQVGDNRWQHLRAKSPSEGLVGRPACGLCRELWLVWLSWLTVPGCQPAVTGWGAWAGDEEERKPCGRSWAKQRMGEGWERPEIRNESAGGQIWGSETVGFAERHCDLGAGDLGLTSALYDLGSLAKGTYPLWASILPSWKWSRWSCPPPLLHKAGVRIKQRHEDSVRQNSG